MFRNLWIVPILIAVPAFSAAEGLPTASRLELQDVKAQVVAAALDVLQDRLSPQAPLLSELRRRVLMCSPTTVEEALLVRQMLDAVKAVSAVR